MPTPKAEVTATAASVENQSKSNTNWAALKGYAITRLQCEDYKEFHRGNLGCHTGIRPTVDNIRAHVHPSHHSASYVGGGFEMHLRNSDKDVKLWTELEKAGMEAVDFRCEICDQQVAFAVNAIEKHMKPHSGKSRRVKDGKFFKITIRDTQVALPVEDIFEDEQ